MITAGVYSLGFLMGSICTYFAMRQFNRELVRRLTSRRGLAYEVEMLERRREARDSGRDTQVRDGAGPPMSVRSVGVMRPGALAKYRLQNRS